MTSSSHIALFAIFVAFACAQLASDQHSTLMSLYDAVGTSFVPQVKMRIVNHRLILFVGCPSLICPRFPSNQACEGARLTCVGDWVDALCDFFFFCCCQFADLTFFLYRVLYDANLTGTIPSFIGGLSKLETLCVDF